MNLDVDFPLILSLLVIVALLIIVIDKFFFMKKRKLSNKKKPTLVEYARSFFPVLLIVFLVRSFLVQPYRVPTGSLEPTIMPGDFIAASQFSYGIRLPVLNYKILDIGEPHHGDIALFHYPKNPSLIFVKRVIGLPKDHIIYKNKILTVNGKVMTQKVIGHSLDVEPARAPIPVIVKEEDFFGIKHKIYVFEQGGDTNSYDIIVPDKCYFMMGDNRDDSDDSRFWGCVPEENLVGKAFLIWMSWNGQAHNIRWKRIGTVL